MNKVILTGRLTREPESRMSQSNMEISRFSLAVQGDFVNRDGERSVEFINCVAFNKLAGTINRYCHKGSLIGVQGRIRNSSYEAQDGSKRYTTDVVVDQMEFLSSKQNNDDAAMAYSPYTPSSAYSPSSNYSPNTDYSPSSNYNQNPEYSPSSDYNQSSEYSSSSTYSPSEASSTPEVETADISGDPYKNFGDEITLSSDDLPF